MRTVGLIALIFPLWQTGSAIRQIRECYFRAAQEKNEVIRLKRMLDTVSENSSPLLICYKGAAEMLNASYAINPLIKMTSFKKGKHFIESSIFRDTSCVELRFVRFTVQHNLPVFLNYSQNMNRDSCMIAQHLLTLSDQDLKAGITGYFARLKGRDKK